ncbi:uncharacterized protein PFL1_04824 [Pseudozyma flocculosa PF-1]|uniref:non-specific serine/threonine protein kinase n=1 Tax=Pseudozyma flocculosa PF-1 TaxID=1277687 RepID=A0A061HAQ8_9BASI|nr:uncharacterized protein PFL1_04824 [Pseudozyma flocculosa PF-1]EPQ27686.1 hypothetical protein PFL1_04824 [Pseudozyma flocculosa PF-1]
MSQVSSRRGAYGSTNGSSINQKAALASAYQELGKELSSGKLKAVGNYTLQRPIGEGTYGKVRLGLHRLTNTRVAIKQVPKAHSASLTREIHHHRRLHHPHVMKLYEVIATEQYIWMVSELCAGGELYDYLVEREYLPEAEARRVFGQLCLAVAYIHAKGIVHRDLKLENVLLDERCNVKLGDFGFTREFEGKRLMDTFCGTTGYAAPEMLAGKRYTGQEVDIWSLGIILYALLCGALPFDDDDEAVMKDKILKGVFELPECLSSEAQDLITSILQLDPLRRPTIETILSHAWFSKVIVSTPMSTLEEDEPALGYFDSGTLPGAVEGSESALVDTPELAGAATPAGDAAAEPSATPHPSTDLGSTEAGASASAAETVNDDDDDADAATDARGNRSRPASPLDDALGTVRHQSSVSGASESSFYSARSDSESSDRRSSTTEETDPTTAESGSKRGDPGDEVDAAEHPASASGQPGAAGLEATDVGARTKLPRNESQSTIRRAGSTGSDASHGAHALRPAGRTTTTASSSLPTHHEHSSDRGSGGAGECDGDGEDTPIAARSSSLQKRGSQGSSSRGHHRTPSRTKRKSISSGGLSDHHPPLVGSRPIDYVAQLTQPQSAAFCTALEQNLLHQLSGLGVDVGQLVHSICTDACDASGALWWMLVRKAQEREPAMAEASGQVHVAPSTPPRSVAPQPHAQPPPASALPPTQTAETSPVPPPLPQKDPSRRSHDRGGRYGMTASKSMDSSLFDSVGSGSGSRLHTVISQEEIDASPSSPGQVPSAKVPGLPDDTPPATRTASGLPLSASLNTLPIAIHATPEHASMTSTTPSKTRPKHRHMPTTPSSLGSGRAQSPEETGSPMGTPKSKRHQHADRARSNSLSMKQFASTVLGTRDKSPQPEQVCVAGENLPFERSKSPSIFGKRTNSAGGGVKEAQSIAGKLATASTPKKASIDASSPSLGSDKGRKSTSKAGAGVGAGADVAAVQRIRAEEAIEAGSRSPGRSGDEAKSTPSASVDSFSTTSLTPQNSERGSKQKSGSSFMATVRTWLGAHEKQGGRKQQKGSAKKVNKAGTSSLGYDGPASASQLSNRPASVRKRSGPYHAAPIQRRPSKASQMGSLSRRSSTGSTKHFNPDYASPPHQQYARPSTLRRLSAGSITPTATLYGDYVQEHHPGHGRTPSRSSRPSSGHSQHLSGLQGRKGSASSGHSAFRKQGGSAYSSGSGRRQSHRLSHDGGTVVRRHRAYGSSSGSPSRRNSRHDSRPGSLRSRNSSPGRLPLEGAVEELDDFARSVQSGISTPRRSLDSSSRRPSSLRHETASGRQSPLSTGTGGAGTGARTPAQAQHHSIFLRDVFANKELDDDWTDEDEEPAYSGGLGQLDSLSGSGWPSDYSTMARNETLKGSPYATRVFRDGPEMHGASMAMPSRFGGSVGGGGGGGSGSGSMAPGSSMLGYGRYAGVRSLFQPPSLGNEFSPKTLSMTFHDAATAASGSSARGSMDTTGGESATSDGGGSANVDGSASKSPSLASAAGSPTAAMVASASGSAAAAAATPTPTPAPALGPGSRVRAGSAAASVSAFKGNHIIEEEEEDE